MRKTVSNLLALAVFVIVVLGLSACSRGRSTPAANTPAAQASATSQPSATLSPTPERKPTQTPTTSLSGSVATSIATANAPSSLQTALPTELPLPSLPDLSGSADDYEPATPSQEQLLELTIFAHRQLETVYGINQYGNRDEGRAERWSWLFDNVQSELYAFSEALDAAFLKAYPDQLPDPTPLFGEPYAGWWTDYPFLAPYPPRFVVGAVVTEINKTGQQFVAEEEILVGPFSLDPYPAELDGTPGQEWVVHIWVTAMDARYNGTAMWQALDENSDGTLSLLGDPVPAQPYLWSSTFQVTDLTGDGLSDLIAQSTAVGFGMQRTDLIAYQWTPTGFTEMSHIRHWEDLGIDELTGEQSIKFFPETHPGLRVNTDVNHSWGCVYKTTEVYRWTGGVEQRVETKTMDTEDPACLLARAADAYSGMSPEEAKGMLERALAGFDPDIEEDGAKISFAHYHLAIIEAALGNDTQARLHLRNVAPWFAEDTITAEYLDENLVPLLRKGQLNAEEICALVFDAPSGVFGSWWEGLKHPFQYGGLTTSDLCNPDKLTEWSLQSVLDELNASPETTLQVTNFDPSWTTSFSIHGVEQPVLLATVNQEQDYQRLFSKVPQAEGVRWIWLDSYPGLDGPAEWINEDITGDGAIDLALAFPRGESDYCESWEHETEVFIAGKFSDDNNVIASFSIDICHTAKEPLDLHILMADEDGDGLSDRLEQEIEDLTKYYPTLTVPEWGASGSIWFNRSTIFDQYDATAEQEAETLKSLFSNTNPAKAREQLFAMRGNLMPDEPGRNYRQQIDYLIALSYELEGQTDEAVNRYLQLARETPQTLWSSLAAVKIRHK